MTAPYSGIRALVTAGPTIEPIDPVRYISNHSSGKQGYAIARTLQQQGATVTLVSGPVSLPAPEGCTVLYVETALEMLHACLNALPADIAICAAAVSDFRPEIMATEKIKRQDSYDRLRLELVANPDILASLGGHPRYRPTIVAGFALETRDALANAKRKCHTKAADMIFLNSITRDFSPLHGDSNHVIPVTPTHYYEAISGSKEEVASQVAEICVRLLQRSKERT